MSPAAGTASATHRAVLNRDSIARAALVVLDRQGATGLTMRAVASELGSSPMGLYHHVADRAELITLMIDVSLREEPMPAPSGEGWREDLWLLARWLLAAARRHPALWEVTGQMAGEATTTLLAFGESWIGLWRTSDLPEARAFEAAITSLGGVVAMVGQSRRPVEAPSVPHLSSLPNMRHAIDRAPDPAIRVRARSA